MPETFGARLRRRREQQQIALSAIAEQTKIQQSLLEGLERDDVSRWPTGIFRRAFIRAYAHAIGLDPDVVVSEFLELHPDPGETIATASALAPAFDGARAGAGPPTRLRWLLDSVVGYLSPPRPGVVVKGGSVPENPAPGPAAVLAPSESDLLATAHLCTELGQVDELHNAAPLLKEATRILDAIGVIVWAWDPQPAELRPVLAHGYSDTVLAQLPRVRRDADNATAAAFRSGQTCVVKGRDPVSGALVVPVITPTGCVGVLAIELPHGKEQEASVRALVTLLAAQLARLVTVPRTVEAIDRRLA